MKRLLYINLLIMAGVIGCIVLPLVLSLAVLLIPIVIVPVAIWKMAGSTGRGQGITGAGRAGLLGGIRSSGSPHIPSPLI